MSSLIYWPVMDAATTQNADDALSLINAYGGSDVMLVNGDDVKRATIAGGSLLGGIVYVTVRYSDGSSEAMRLARFASLVDEA